MAVETRPIGLMESERLIELAAEGGPLRNETNPLSVAYRAGDLIAGKYRLLRLIGRGGMGVVWEAHSDALDIRVAIKLIHQFTASTEEQQRLLLEAKAAARLVDPGVVRVFDCGETRNGEPYVVMELLEGEDLATRLDERGRIQPIDAVRTLLPILRALGTAHAANIVHRDVKPENVFFTKSATGEEQPKLLDFGIAKVELPWEKRLTQAGSTLGSPNYMSPEQAKGEEVDGRSDLWGFCVVLYETIAGELPFDGTSYNAVMHAILTAKVASFPELGINQPELWAIVARGLERDQAQRWQSSAELADALGAWLIARGIMHDVTGVSLHATKSAKRESFVRTLESVRPARPERDVSPSANSALAQTSGSLRVSGPRFWAQRPRWFVPALAVLGLAGIAISWWKIRIAREPDPQPASAAVLSAVPAPLLSQAASPSSSALPSVLGGTDKTAYPLEDSPGVAKVSPATSGANRNGKVRILPKEPSPKEQASKSSTKPQQAKPKGNEFKSPFD